MRSKIIYCRPVIIFETLRIASSGEQPHPLVALLCHYKTWKLLKLSQACWISEFNLQELCWYSHRDSSVSTLHRAVRTGGFYVIHLL